MATGSSHSTAVPSAKNSRSKSHLSSKQSNGIGPSIPTESMSDGSVVTPKAQQRTHQLRGQITPLSSRLSRPFKSPLSALSAEPRGCPSPSQEIGLSDIGKRVATRSARSERQELEARLLVLQQTAKYLRDDSLRTMPKLIGKWRQAGQDAAQDLWIMTGANTSDFRGSVESLTDSKGDYGLESQSYSQEDSQSRKRKRKEVSSPHCPPLELPSRRMSAGEEELANGLRGQSYDADEYQNSDASSSSSLPDVTELMRRSQKLYKGKETTASTATSDSRTGKGRETTRTLVGNGTERSWTVGRMLDELGANKDALGWDAEEEEFQTRPIA